MKTSNFALLVLWDEIDSPHKGSVIQKMYPCHYLKFFLKYVLMKMGEKMGLSLQSVDIQLLYAISCLILYLSQSSKKWSELGLQNIIMHDLAIVVPTYHIKKNSCDINLMFSILVLTYISTLSVVKFIGICAYQKLIWLNIVFYNSFVGPFTWWMVLYGNYYCLILHPQLLGLLIPYCPY